MLIFSSTDTAELLVILLFQLPGSYNRLVLPNMLLITNQGKV